MIDSAPLRRSDGAHSIEGAFAAARAQNRIGLIAFLTVGYPTPDATRHVALALVEGGADLIELGIPFSDPLADGATVQRASYAALQQGVNVACCLETAAAIRAQTPTPLAFMGYYNPILRFGVERFCQHCAAAGVNGLIVPDLPPEEAGELKQACHNNGLALVFLVAPTSTEERLARVAAEASGFVYCVSLSGTTGARAKLAHGLREFVGRVRQHTDLPLAVGFGVSRPEHVAEIATFADGAVVGSALIDLLDALPPAERTTGMTCFIADLRATTARPAS